MPRVWCGPEEGCADGQVRLTMRYLDQDVTADELGNLSALESAAAAPLSNLTRRPGESLAAWGKRLKGGDRTLAAKQKTRTRSGGSTSAFDQLHPRGRGGQWIVKQGATGAEARAVQSQVGAKVDGDFGTLTKQAVMAFQRKHHIQVDGIVGAQTVAAMMGKRRAAQVKAGAMTPADRRWLLRQS